jgi:hypothetical protein
MAEETLRHEHTVRSTALFVAAAMLFKRIHSIRDTSPWQAASAPIAGELKALESQIADYGDWLLRASRDDLVPDEERAALYAHPLLAQAGGR